MQSLKSYRSAKKNASFSNSFSAVTRSILASVSLSKLTLETNKIHNTGLFNNYCHEMAH